jgi:beta-galactosidase
MDLSGLHLRFATAQPLAILGTAAAPVYAFFIQSGIEPEFVIDDTPGLKLDRSQNVMRHDGAIWMHATTPGPSSSIHFTLADGKSVTLVLVRQQDAEMGWKIASGDHKQLLVTDQQAFVDNDTATLEHIGDPHFVARLLPEMHTTLLPFDPNIKLNHDGTAYSTGVPKLGPSVITLTPTQIKPADAPAPLPADFKPSNRPRVVAAAPTDADFSRAGVWSISLPKSIATALKVAGRPSDAPYFLRIHYTGDVARLSVNGHLLDDNFADGRPWLVGLTRFAPQLTNNQLQLSIYPLRPNPPIFFEPGNEPKPDAPTAIQSVELLTQYTLKLKLVPQPTKKP